MHAFFAFSTISHHENFFERKRHPLGYPLFKKDTQIINSVKMKLGILFYINKRKTNSKGNCAIICRLTYDKVRKSFSTGLFINPSLWDSKSQLVKPPNEENDIVNTQLSLIRNKVNQAFLMLQIQQSSFGVYDIYSTYKREKIA